MPKYSFCCVCQAPIGTHFRSSGPTPVIYDQIKWWSFCRIIPHLNDPASSFEVSQIYYTVDGLSPEPLPSDAQESCQAGNAIQGDGQDRNMAHLLGCTCTPTSKCELRKHGYKIHAYCWSVLERVAGPLAFENLDVCLKSIDQVWQASSICLADWHLGHSETVCVPDLTTHCSWMNYAAACFAKADDPLTMRSPMQIPGLEAAIEWCKTSNNLTVSGDEPRKNVRSPLNKLPLELHLEILDALTDNMDIVNAIRAFGWQIPDGYLKQRTPCKAIYELDPYGVCDIDWLKLMEQFGCHHKLFYNMKSRLHIFGIAADIHTEMARNLSGNKSLV
ncbi:hypothetical protein LOZ66_006592 [Ophidiomyces ophidiicola]|nr:hypothetical protein LOZ66_006592 [Ophidiomyces ophidiicola]